MIVSCQVCPALMGNELQSVKFLLVVKILLVCRQPWLRGWVDVWPWFDHPTKNEFIRQLERKELMLTLPSKLSHKLPTPK
jgi:hypothetical protein